MTTVTPLVSPPLDDIRNAAQIAEAWAGISQGQVDQEEGDPGPYFAFRDIARLIRHALESLSEPSLAAMQAGEILLKEWSGTPEPQRQLRDTIHGILNAQLTGEIPRTWECE